MIYPTSFPLDVQNSAEIKVYNVLQKLDSNNYDIFYSRKFAAVVKGERSEYEADFIIADLNNNRLNAILIIEVKGGRITFNGASDEWKQNGRPLDDPTKQVTGIMHSLVNRYADISRRVPFGWSLCFPEIIAPDANQMPSVLNSLQLIDSLYLSAIEKQLPELFKYIREQNPGRYGDDLKQYQSFKESLLRGLGAVIPLHKQIDFAEQRFIQLTTEQMQLLHIVSANKNIFVTGPAGSGKTVMATTLAREEYEAGQKVLLLTFNRVLANNIRNGLQLPRDQQQLDVATYHSIARRKIDEFDPQWWAENSKTDEFWTLGAAIKLDELLKDSEPEYDVIIVDEGQDFYELWFESLDKLLKPAGSFYVFMDEHQNIFKAYTKIPVNRNFLKFPLTKNCRNTKNIINYLEQLIDGKIELNQDTPEGEPLRIIDFKNDVEQLNKIKDEWRRLVEEENISPDRIVLMFNTLKKESCIGNTRKFGKYPIEAVDRRSGKPNPKAVNYTTINTFKGLEADIVFIIDTDKVENPDYKVLYTQASRAKYILYILRSNKSYKP